MKRSRIMIAQDPELLARTIADLGNYELVCVSRYAAAVHLLDDDKIELFVIGVHFDESQAVPLVLDIRELKNHTKTPIIFVRMNPSARADLLRKTIKAIEKTHGIKTYLELDDECGASAKVRAAVDKALTKIQGEMVTDGLHRLPQ